MNDRIQELKNRIINQEVEIDMIDPYQESGKYQSAIVKLEVLKEELAKLEENPYAPMNPETLIELLVKECGAYHDLKYYDRKDSQGRTLKEIKKEVDAIKQALLGK